ncbi:hypothetical protein [Castellaniella sp.]|uniref:hypothetical protein n=1 Tax=Castellaniella sp. TaxID=1955812 RepID=UPI002AFF910E|nr:hypothetical protein [Castellaniella sp.]
MLEDLDALSQRVQRTVQLAQGLQAERAALQAKIQQLQQQYLALQAQQATERDEFARMSERLARHDLELQAVRNEATQTHGTLETQLHEQHARAQSLQQRLLASEADCDRLRVAATGAQEQIELILERLPGAEV